MTGKKAILALIGLLMTATAWAQEGVFTATFAGDYGATPHTGNVLDTVGSHKPDVHLAIGDFSYSQLPEKKWCGFVKKRVKATPFLLLAGNHESDDKDGEISKFAACLPYHFKTPIHGAYPSEYYFDSARDHPLVRFIMISPDLNYKHQGVYHYSKGNAHITWLARAVESAREAHIPWVVVAMHKVCMTTSSKECEIGEELMKQLIDMKVDLVIAGHVHAYERTYPLTCATPYDFDPKCRGKTNGSDYEQGEGTVFVTAGTGGVNFVGLDPAHESAPYFARRYGLHRGQNSESDDLPFGIGKLRISSGRMQASFIEARTGEILDEFSINTKTRQEK